MPKAAQYEATATGMSREAATVLEPLTKLACASSLTPEVPSFRGETMPGAWALALLLLNAASALAILPHADEDLTGSIRGMQLRISFARKLAGRDNVAAENVPNGMHTLVDPIKLPPRRPTKPPTIRVFSVAAKLLPLVTDFLTSTQAYV